ncbi:MAG: MFS transporter, partial [Oscillospiraceae bacterium]
GGYDLEKMKLDGAIGVGVLFEHYKKDEYIKFCQKQSGKTLFGFGLVLTQEEIGKILAKLEEIKTRTYVWECRAQQAEKVGESTAQITDYASELYKATGATFYKFSSGSFKYYWVLGTNCVRLADTLLCASGLDTIVNGIITPGTYYDYLNREFMRNGSRVVKRTVYLNPKNEG